MTLKTRLAWMVLLLMSALVLSYSLVLLSEMRHRADAETEAALPWMVELMPERVEAPAVTQGDAVERLVLLVRRLERIRHVRVDLRSPDGELLASAPRRSPELPAWFARSEATVDGVRKDVYFGAEPIAYFEVRPASDDEFAELWEDFVRNSLLVIGLSLAAGLAITWVTFRALQPVERIRDALREVGDGANGARLPPFRTPEMDEIATAFNRMSGELEAAREQQKALMRRLVEREEQTRRSVAHDLHDDLSPYLVALQPLGRMLQMTCARHDGPLDISQAIETLITHQSNMLTTLRRILVGLHPPELETMGLRGALEQLVAQRNAATEGHCRISFEAREPWRSLGPVLDSNVYRMVQECLTNAMRHATPRRIEVRITRPSSLIDIHVRNDGVRASPSRVRSGFGTLGMRERCIALGGRFASRADADGWLVHIELPDEVPTTVPT